MGEDVFQQWYFNQTVLHPMGFVAILVLGMTMLLVPRPYAVLPMLVMACFVAPAQRVAIFELNFDLLRIMVLFGTLRLIVRGELGGLRWMAMDGVLAAWAIVGSVVYVLQWGTLEALKYKAGECYDIVGMYFLFRHLVRDWADVQRMILGVILIAIPVAGAFLIELTTAHNPFAALGGVPAITMMRDGRLRCQGAFSHPITAGCFWAALMPMIAVYWFKRGTGPMLAAAGLVAAGVVVLATASSTPLSAAAVGAVALGMFGLRGWMRPLRWGALGLLVGLHLVMKAPVWHLISRVDLVGGSTGWHRYILIDETIRRFGEWWLLGTRSTREWGDGLQDITNQYVFEAVRGGLVTLVLFVALLSLAFAAVGRIWRAAGVHRNRALLAWAIGAALFVHAANFFAVAYFGQIIMLFLLQLAVIASLDELARARKPVPERQAMPRPTLRTVPALAMN